MRMRRVALVLVAMGIACAPAAAFVVDSTDDASDGAPGDAVCATALGACTLRAAVEEANASPGQQSVQLASRTYARTIASELDVTDDVQLFAPSGIATIDAAGLGRVLRVRPGATLHLSQVAITGGGNADGLGGAGVLNEGELRLFRVVVQGNDSGNGAGIRNVGRLVAEQAYLQGNVGAGLLNEGQAELTLGELAGNEGVGLLNRAGARLDFVHVNRNQGGIVSSGVGASVEVLRSVLASNGGVGALYVGAGTAHLWRSTVSGNTGSTASAVYAEAGTLSLESTTIAANGAAGSPAVALDGTAAATVRAINTLVAGNVGSAADPDCGVTVTSVGHNLMSCPLSAPDPTTFAADPRVAPLRRVAIVWPAVGFQTLVHPLLPGSPAIDAGVCIGWPDQRGVVRPAGPGCDIGAYETTPLCTGGAGIAGTRVDVRRRDLAGGGSSTVKMRGRLSFMDPLNPLADPAEDGLQLRIEEASSPGGAFVERTMLTDALTAAGWIDVGSRFRWKSSGPGQDERLVVKLADKRASGAGIDVKATARGPLPSATGPLRVTVVLGGDALGGNAAGDAGACASAVVACASDASGRRLKCR